VHLCEHRRLEFRDFDHTGLAAHQGRNGQVRLGLVLGFDHRPAGVHSAQTAPVKVSKVTLRRLRQLNVQSLKLLPGYFIK
jgi:hypothetical protein